MQGLVDLVCLVTYRSRDPDAHSLVWPERWSLYWSVRGYLGAVDGPDGRRVTGAKSVAAGWLMRSVIQHVEVCLSGRSRDSAASKERNAMRCMALSTRGQFELARACNSTYVHEGAFISLISPHLTPSLLTSFSPPARLTDELYVFYFCLFCSFLKIYILVVQLLGK